MCTFVQGMLREVGCVKEEVKKNKSRPYWPQLLQHLNDNQRQKYISIPRSQEGPTFQIKHISIPKI